LFFLVLLFNFFGYRLVIAYLEKGSNTVMEQKLDRFDYNEDELISIKQSCIFLITPVPRFLNGPMVLLLSTM
jgi:hypothetical protein